MNSLQYISFSDCVEWYSNQQSSKLLKMQIKLSTFLPRVVGKTPRLIFLVFASRIPAIVVTSDEFNVAEVVREEEVPRLARVPGLRDTDCASVNKELTITTKTY